MTVVPIISIMHNKTAATMYLQLAIPRKSLVPRPFEMPLGVRCQRHRPPGMPLGVLCWRRRHPPEMSLEKSLGPLV